MDEAALERGLCGVVLEMALKMGLTASPVALNYPMGSLRRMLGENLSPEEVREALEAFFAARRSRFGEVRLQPHEDGLCLTIPAEGVGYIVKNAPGADFLRDLIRTAQTPGVAAEDLVAAFRRHSARVHVEPVEHAEFDLLVYFEDGVPDDFRYCIDVHEGFVSYHRFSREDYEAFGF